VVCQPQNALRLSLLICILTTLSGTIGCRSDEIRVRSWDDAVRFSLAELDAAGDLEGRLEGYSRTAQELSAQIQILERARPALALIDSLQDVQIPLIGNGWQILLTLLSTLTVDGAKAIAKLEEVLSALSRLKDSLDGLASLPGAAASARSFRSQPSPRTLSVFADDSGRATSALGRLRDELGPVLDPLADVQSYLGGLLSGLRAAAEAGIPIVSDAARRAAEGIGKMENPLLEVRDGLQQLYDNVETDIKSLERIQEAVRLAREHSQ
jgi:hypothetical protein